MKLSLRRLKLTSLSLTLLALSSQTYASDFSLPFVNVSSLGTGYADWATAASDASTSFTNPAGLTELNHHQQLVFSPMGILGSTKFTGTATTPPFPFPGQVQQTGSASSHIGAFMPSFYYSIPITDRLVLAIGETIPFALGTTYAADSMIRYTATRSKIVVGDIGPSFGFKVDDKLSVGLGFDAARMVFTLDNMFGPPISTPDSLSTNNLYSWGFGWHTGVLYKVLPTTRLGLSFNSMLMFHASGNSQVFTPFGNFRTTNQKSNAALPARTQLSIQHDFTQRWTGMATFFYTNWRTLDKIVLKNVILPGGSTTGVTIPLNYHNTFDYSLGATFKATEKWLLRVGITFLQTPSNNTDRGVADPIGAATIPALGAHYQQNKCLGYDVGYAHSFFKQAPINHVNAITSAVGHTDTQTNVFGAQVTWNIG
jgi:long-chain fatty acid transport protein